MMDAVDSIDPYSRPARRTQWVVSTLAYHYGLDRGVENEIIVLATGLDQYLQEIFHHMDYQGGGKIPAEDFNVLCELLGLDKDSEDTECAGVLEDLPGELTFRHFHAKLCGYFSTKAGRQYEDGRLLVGKDSEHIETQIRLRSPLRRREKLLCEGARRRSGGRHASGRRLASCTEECYEEIVALEEAEDRVATLEDENASLRELIEDMRAALQSSDARCLALQVGLWKRHSKHKPEEGVLAAHQKQVAQKSLSNLKSLQSIIHEIELLRSSRDLQVEEARQALLSGLDKVKELEAEASHVPTLQRLVLQLESELLFYRLEVSKLQPPSGTGVEQQQPGAGSRSDSQHDRCSPTGRAMTTPDKMDEQLFRSVEGQAASDEEDDKWTEDQQRQVDEVKRILTRLSRCGERCHDEALKKRMSSYGSWRSEESCSAVLELLERVTVLHKHLEAKESQAEMDMDQMKDSLVQELQQKAEETELLQVELRMLETERVRLSLVEEKLMDILQLLQQLRDLNVSRRSLGKLLLSTLGSCSDPQHGKAHIVEVLNALYHELAACEVLSTGGALGPSQRSGNALFISC
uniref:EF-hand and coiled-coil domain containing 1 n=1 Tax=Gasterosteus aculeatus aculeatus TaxID=481459 RepID=A0AAQ4S9U8_GASAC